MTTADAEKEAYLATRLIGLMILRARVDREAAEPSVRESANEWLESRDEGLASMMAVAQHLASCCRRLSPVQRGQMADRLSLRSPDDVLVRAAAWREISLEPSINDRELLKVVDDIADAAYPHMAPEVSEQEIAPIISKGLISGPGR